MVKSDIKVARLHKLDGTGSVKAFCSVSVNDEILIKGYKIVDGKEGLFVSCPAECGKDGKWYEIAMPLTTEMRDHIESVILTAFEETL